MVMTWNLSLLAGCIIVGGENGIHIIHGEDGRPNGTAFVELASQEDVTLALSKNKNRLGRRYVEGCISCLNWLIGI